MQTLQRAGACGLDIPTLAKLSDVRRPTVYRYLDVLLQMGYASRHDDIYRYQNPHLVPLSPDQKLLDRLAHAMCRISEVTGDSSFLVTRKDNDALCLHRELGAYPVQVLAVTVGHRQPLGVGAAGLALLASQSNQDIATILANNAQRLHHYGGMSTSRLHLLIRATRERSWSVVGNSAVPGVLGVGVAVKCPRQGVNYAVSVSGLMSRMPVTRQRFIAARIGTELEKAVASD